MTIHVTRHMSLIHALVAVLLIVFHTAPAVATSKLASGEDNVLIIRNDFGGSVKRRFYEIRELVQNDTKVEIRGGFCFSSCTMYIGLRNTCVTPNANFGFHGPRSFGGLSQESFEEWSVFISRYYPEPIRKWYLETGRNTVNGLYKISGAQLIKLGVKECSSKDALAEVP